MEHKYLKGMGLFITCSGLIAGMAVPAGAKTDKSIWEYTEGKEDGHIIYNFQEIDLELPEKWEGKYEIENRDDGSVGFYHKDSREAGNKDGDTGCGTLFSMNYSENYDFAEKLPNYYLVGSGKKGVYYITFPGDLHGYQKDVSILNEWKEMSEDVDWICENTSSENPGAPMYTIAGVNFRDGETTKSKVINVIPSNGLVWVTGNMENGWAQVTYDGERGYVKEDYLEFPSVIEESINKDTEKETDKNTETDTNKGSDSDTPQQGTLQMVLYNVDNDERVVVKRADDGIWYDESGVSYGDVDKSFDEGEFITNENGDTFYWQLIEKDEAGTPVQGEIQAMLYSADGVQVLVKRAADGNWYDENGVSYGDVGDATITGAQVINENGEEFYFTLQQ